MPPSAASLNPDLLTRIPLAARTILIVGGKGSLAAAYRRMNPTARLLGLEPDAEAAAIAQSEMDQVAVLDLEADQLPLDCPDGIDCIIFPDTLQTFKDPAAVLRRFALALNPDGVVLICVPNIEHWSFTARLMQGTWAYDPAGLLDANHLRWFTRDTMRRLLHDAGLVACDVSGRVFDRDAAEAFARVLEPALQTLGIAPQAYLDRATPLQYVWRARVVPRQPLLVAGSMLNPVGGVSHVRVVHPFRAMETDPTVTTRILSALDDEAPGPSPRIFVLHRPALAGASGLAVLRTLLSNGWLVVTEFDDNPDFLPAMQDKDLAFRGVHAVQTSTPALANVLRARNPEIAVFPNAIPDLPDPTNFTDRHMTLFFGALNREEDWRSLMPTLNAVIRQAQDRLRFQVVHDGGFYAALETPHKTFTPTCDYETYLSLLGGSEISFMPLSDNGFNRTKSDLKFIEAGACRVASLASSVVYGDSVVEGETGLIFRDPEELRVKLLTLLDNREGARQIGENARRYVMTDRMLAYQVEARISWYRTLWARREELTTALRVRLARDAATRPLLAAF